MPSNMIDRRTGAGVSLNSSVVNGLLTSVAIKAPVVVQTTANITLSGEQTINSVAVVDGDRVLVKDQTDQTENGIYIVSTGTWSRAPDFSGSRDVVRGTRIFSANGSVSYRLTTANPIVFGTSEIVFAQEVPGGEQDFLNVLDYGADPSGVQDSTAEIQAALDEMSEYSTLYFPAGRYLISTNLTKSSVNHLSFVGDSAVLYDATGALTGMLFLTSCDYVKVSGLAFESVEDNTYFQANTPSEVRAGLRLLTCDNAVVLNIRGKSKRNLLYASSCPYLIVDGYRHEGIFGAVSSGAASNANYAFTIDLLASHRSVVSNGVVNNHGSAVLVQSNSENLTITNITGKELHDNGIYVSSGRDTSISNCSFENIVGDGVKVRSIGATITGVSVENADSRGIVVTGLDGGTVDSEGATGYGFSITGCELNGCTRGIEVDDVTDDYARSVSIVGNVVVGSTETASLIPGGIGALTLSKDVCVSGNVVTDFASDLGIEVRGVDATDRAANVVCSNNVISRGTGSASSTRGGIRIYCVDNVTVVGNVFDDIACGIGVRLNEVTKGVVSGNSYLGGQVVRFPSGETVEDLLVAGNYGATISGDGDNNVIGFNYATVTGLPAKTTTPLQIGQTTVASGAAYLATAVSAASDWKLITPCAGVAYRDATQGPITSETKIQFNATDVSALSRGSFDTSTNYRYTTDGVGGRVLVVVRAEITGLDAGDEALLTLKRDGTIVGQCKLRNDSGTGSLTRTMEIVKLLSLSANQYLEAYLTSDTDGVTLAAGIDSTSLEIVELS